MLNNGMNLKNMHGKVQLLQFLIHDWKRLKTF